MCTIASLLVLLFASTLQFFPTPVMSFGRIQVLCSNESCGIYIDVVNVYINKMNKTVNMYK